MFGNPETTTGGRALKFYSSVRIDTSGACGHKEGDVVTGSRTRVKIVKNKVAAPFRESEFDILYGEGISREGDLLDLAVAQNILEKSGSWFSYKGERIGQGRENARTFLKENKDTMAKLDAEVRKALGWFHRQASAAPAAATARRTGDDDAERGGSGEGVGGKAESILILEKLRLDWFFTGARRKLDDLGSSNFSLIDGVNPWHSLTVRREFRRGRFRRDALALRRPRSWRYSRLRLRLRSYRSRQPHLPRRRCECG